MDAGFIIDLGWSGSDGRAANFATRLISQKSTPMKKTMMMMVLGLVSIGMSSIV